MRVLWGRKTSINVQKVAWVLAETGLDYKQIDAGGVHGGLDAPDYRAMNPIGRVPTLCEGDVALWESNAICRYIVDAHGGGLAQKTAVDRARADIWMEWYQNSMYAAFIAMFYQTVRLPKSQRDAGKLDQALSTLHRGFEIAEEALRTGPYLTGAQMSLGDVPFGAGLFRYYSVDISRPDWPLIRAYYERLAARAAYRSHVMVDFESLRAPD